MMRMQTNLGTCAAGRARELIGPMPANVHPRGTEAHVAAVLAILLDLYASSILAHDYLVLRAPQGLRSTTVTQTP